MGWDIAICTYLSLQLLLHFPLFVHVPPCNYWFDTLMFPLVSVFLLVNMWSCVSMLPMLSYTAIPFNTCLLLLSLLSTCTYASLCEISFVQTNSFKYEKWHQLITNHSFYFLICVHHLAAVSGSIRANLCYT